MKVLPLFADFMLLPRIVDQFANVSVQNNLIVVRSDQATDIAKTLEHYPNLKIVRSGPMELTLHPVPLTHSICVVHWPDGKRVGLTLYSGEWITHINPEAVDSLMAAGMPVHIVHARDGEGLRSALTRFAQ